AAFVEANRGAGRDVLEELRKRMTPGANRTDEPYLDLEAITLAPGIADPSQTHVYAVAEEPHSAVLELALEGRGEQARARLVAVYAYAERPGEFGSVHNDGLEGLAWSGEPGRFYFAEEATRKLNDEPRSLQLFSLDPRLGVAELKAGRVVPGEPGSEKMTAAIRGCRKGRMQTLNALTVLRDGRVLAVDRNGGWIDEVDPRNGTARAWLNLYDLDGVNLREVLADFPRKRNMPYVSIEGLALDDAGAMWLVDAPAMPEGWRESCLVRINGPGLARGGASAPAGAGP
ncbi:MAG: esterase-like activity of phytase family protein, partial [Phycisphaerae bacterium]